jgi:hypothetical protein
MPIPPPGETRSPMRSRSTTALDAFRDDTAAHPTSVPADAAGWLMVATQLEHVVATDGAAARTDSLRRFLGAQGVLSIGPRTRLVQEVVAFVEPIAVAAEDAAWFIVADQILQSLCTLLGEDDWALFGRLVAWRARMARQQGDLVTAKNWYDEVGALGERRNSNDLRARAELGCAILAQNRGNYVESREYLHRVLALDGIGADLRMGAHHTLMVAAATAREFSEALVHAWKAYEASATPVQQTEMLLNVAQLLVDVGRPRTGLRAFSAAMARPSVPPRLTLPILGGAAVAAARCLDRNRAPMLVHRFLEQLEGVFRGIGSAAALPYAAASALVEFREALAATGSVAASQRMAARARALAETHRYYELLLVLDKPVDLPRHVAIPLDEPAEGVVAFVETLDGAELVGAV